MDQSQSSVQQQEIYNYPGDNKQAMGKLLESLHEHWPDPTV
jgi:hypothetical protein